MFIFIIYLRYYECPDWVLACSLYLTSSIPDLQSHLSYIQAHLSLIPNVNYSYCFSEISGELPNANTTMPTTSPQSTGDKITMNLYFLTLSALTALVLS